VPQHAYDFVFVQLSKEACRDQDGSAAWTWSRGCRVGEHGVGHYDFWHWKTEFLTSFLHELVNVDFFCREVFRAAFEAVLVEDLACGLTVDFSFFEYGLFVNFFLYTLQLVWRIVFLEAFLLSEWYAVFEQMDAGVVSGYVPVSCPLDELIGVEDEDQLDCQNCDGSYPTVTQAIEEDEEEQAHGGKDNKEEDLGFEEKPVNGLLLFRRNYFRNNFFSFPPCEVEGILPDLLLKIVNADDDVLSGFF